MAKKRARSYISFVCETCKQQNYVSEKNKINTTEALKLNKYCKQCKKVESHKENKKLD
jgi:large subunit ribosomal protein L33